MKEILKRVVPVAVGTIAGAIIYHVNKNKDKGLSEVKLLSKAKDNYSTGNIVADYDFNNKKLKILVICQYYKPEPFRISDICEELVNCGHQVTVVTGIPNYPMGEIYDGYKNNKKRDEKINGVKIHRCFTIPRKIGPVHRLLNYYSYSLSSSRYIGSLPGDFDVVFINQLSPVMMA